MGAYYSGKVWYFNLCESIKGTVKSVKLEMKGFLTN